MHVHRARWIGLAAAGLIVSANPARGATIGIHSLGVSSTTVGLYEPLTVSFGLSKSYSNPYDPDQITVNFEFTGPSGVTRRIPAYWTDGTPAWRARIVPLEIGPHTGRVVAFDAVGDNDNLAFSFTAVPSSSRGFVRIDPRNPRYLRFDNGEPYRPIGQNVAWYGGDSLFTTWLNQMAAAGQNWTRYWLVPYVSQDIEWGGGTSSQLGRYSQSNARLLDNMFDAARTRGIYVQACLDSFNGWNVSLFDNWSESPYNTDNGGMCERPIDFFTNSDAQRYAKRRFRYIVARWAWNPAILCWEFFNEVDAVGSPGATFWGNEPDVAAWHATMAQYVRSIDPFAHLRTTSFADDGPRASYELFWELPELDIVQVHQYSNTYPWDHVSLIREAFQFEKPVILGEGDAAGTPGNLDGSGQSLHDIIWAAAVVQSGAMSWWWDNWIHPKNLYYRFKPLAAFLAGEDWAPQELQAANPTVLSGHTAPQVFGSAGPAHAYLYIRDLQGSVSGLRLQLEQVVRTGPYTLEWWDTNSQSAFLTTTATGDPGGLILNVPAFNRDIAVKVKHAGPGLETTVGRLEALGYVAHQPAAVSFGVRNSGTGEIGYEVSSNAFWCAIAPGSGSVGSETDMLTVSFNAMGLSAGTYTGEIRVTDVSGQSPPAVLALTLTLSPPPGDGDGDGDVDQEDFGLFQNCLTGPGLAQTEPGCLWSRLDNDLDVDTNDTSLFQACLSRPDVPSAPDCLE